MKLNGISIKGLFGYLDHEIALSENENITLIHGPNGCGKTTVLELLHAIFKSDFRTLSKTPYSLLKLTFSDSSRLSIEKEITQQVHPSPRKKIALNYTLTKRGTQKKEATVEYPSSPREGLLPSFMIEREFPFLHRIGPMQWRDRKSGEILTTEAVTELYGDHVHIPSKVRRTKPLWLSELLRKTPILFIGSERLVRRTSGRYSDYEDTQEKVTDTIEVFAKELGEIVSEKLAESVSISQSLDRTFPSRLLDRRSRGDVSEERLRAEYALIENKRREMMSVGLIEEEGGVPLPQQSMDSTEARVLSLYLADTLQKLTVFDELQRRLSAFIDIINGKMGSTKIMSIDRRKGFFFSQAHGDHKQLRPRDLSSGEQHQVVLFYELLFKSKPNSIVLIDEPEISLHVEWQRQFLKDLKKVTSLSSHSFIIATHSPQIIHDSWDLAVPLSGGICRE